MIDPAWILSYDFPQVHMALNAYHLHRRRHRSFLGNIGHVHASFESVVARILFS
jgi:hypothetical protein